MMSFILKIAVFPSEIRKLFIADFQGVSVALPSQYFFPGSFIVHCAAIDPSKKLLRLLSWLASLRSSHSRGRHSEEALALLAYLWVSYLFGCSLSSCLSVPFLLVFFGSLSLAIFSLSLSLCLPPSLTTFFFVFCLPTFPTVSLPVFPAIPHPLSETKICLAPSSYTLSTSVRHPLLY